MTRSVLWLLSGIVCGGFAVSLVQGLFGVVVTVPPMPVDPELVDAWVAAIPFVALLAVVVAWGVGGFVAGGMAALGAHVHPLRWGQGGGAVMGLVTLGNLVLSPFSHPAWMWVAGPLLPVVLGHVAGSLVVAQGRAQPAPPIG